jgi:hypothetical protein
MAIYFGPVPGGHESPTKAALFFISVLVGVFIFDPVRTRLKSKYRSEILFAAFVCWTLLVLFAFRYL